MAELTWYDGGVERRATWLSPTSDRPPATGTTPTTGRPLGRPSRSSAAGSPSGTPATTTTGGSSSRPWRAGSAGPGSRPATRPRRWRAERERRRTEHEVLSRLFVPIEAGFRLPLRRAPDVTEALSQALGEDAPLPGLLPLRDLLGMVGAHEWRRRGVHVPALGAAVHPHYGVYAPVRGEYVDLVARAAAAWPVAGKRALDVGTGTGVLALVLARAGASVVATDVEPRAVLCARENVERLGLGARVEVRAADLFPDGEADLVVSNPPWLPDEARTPLERAVYDPGGRLLERLVLGLPAHLAAGGEAWVVLSDLAELLGLRPTGHVAALAARAGLSVADTLEARPAHRRAEDPGDPLHAFRAREVTRLFRLLRA